MKHAVYNHNRDIYISYPLPEMPLAKSGNIICANGLALFTVNVKEAETPVIDLIKDKWPLYHGNPEMIHILVLYVSNDKSHQDYLKATVLESDEFRATITVNINGMTGSLDSKVVSADFSLPHQQRFVHLNTKSLRYV
jgi:hypothetical protein